ncbi:hypothetical protein [Dictyobacter aurantiacus]|uniref:Uncharacterized protein n=1 Tax=Dictyobacter aurantiacus TaxID=1936993 RepID=A0A401ZDU7_9CHLR|nr:hypothetical protein [Dictyobacter aurantiacus]GCE05025.1 hypothetical protein KDAU_23540 [Dictyobacter aurantiacus]
MAERPSDILTETELLDRAVWRKWNKYTWSGLLIVGIGCLLIVVGLMLKTGAYSAEGLLVGIGAIVVLIGLIRVAIGLINPLSPSDIRVQKRRRKEVDADPILSTLQSDETGPLS